MKVQIIGLIAITLMYLATLFAQPTAYARPVADTATGPAMTTKLGTRHQDMANAMPDSDHRAQRSIALTIPADPTPTDNATHVPLNQVLSWQENDFGGSPVVTYTVAFGTNNPPPDIAQVFTTSFDPGPLLTNTTYYWQIEATDGLSNLTGPLWQFTTTPAEFLLYLPTIFKVALDGLPPPGPTGMVAFPGAQGFGAKATGGRGGQVLKVTTLSADGGTAGSLQWALNQAGPRIIVFAVSGVIEGDIRIPHGDLTLAGQTAPGAGITILGHLYTPFGADIGNIIIRHLRVRPPNPDSEWPPNQHDAFQFSTAHTLIFDHVDASHGADEIIDLWGGAYDVTVQWSAITYPIYDPANGWTHHKGLLNHRACIDGGNCSTDDPLGGRISIHHNLFAHARNRTPALSTGPADVRNNVIYNGREGFVHHNIVGAADPDPSAIGEFNIIGNYYRQGPSAALAPFWFDPENSNGPIPTRYWVWNNYVDDPGDFEGRVDNPFTTPGFANEYTFFCCGIEANQFNNGAEFDFGAYAGYAPISTDEPAIAYNLVLARAGAWPRDIVTTWAVDDTQNRGGAWGNRRPADWLEGLTPTAPPLDSDNDGMPDAWENTHGLNPNDGSDHSTVMPSGYTAIEEYINELAESLVSGS